MSHHEDIAFAAPMLFMVVELARVSGQPHFRNVALGIAYASGGDRQAGVSAQVRKGLPFSITHM